MIILVRHGEATHHTQRLTGGWTDSQLTEKGRAQIKAAAVKLAKDFAGRNCKLRILASDLQRASASAQIIADELGFKGEIEHCRFLREFYRRNVHGLWHCADVDKENLLIVAHKGTIQNIIFRWLGMDMQQVAAFNFSVDVQPASVTVLGINKWHEHAVFRLNDVSHLTQGKGFGVFEFKYEK